MSTSIGSAQAAGTGVLSLTPASGSYQVGSTLTLSVYEDSGTESVNAVEADLTYDQTKLKFENSNTNIGVFDLPVAHNNGSGVVMLSVAKIGGSFTGKQLVGTITFTVLAKSGTGSISFNRIDPNTNAYSSAIMRTSDTSNIWNQNISTATYTFTDVPASGGGGGGSTGGTTTTTTTTTQTAPKTGTTTTGTTSTSTTTSTPAETTTGSTQGYFVAVLVEDANSKPVVGATVSVGDFSTQTNAYGVANFTSLPSGSQVVTIKTGGKTIKQNITVSPNAQPQDVQTFHVRVAGVSTLAGRWYLYLLGLMLIVLVLGGGLSLKRMMVSRSQNLAMAGPATTPPAPAAPTVPSGSPGPQVFYPDASAPTKPSTEDK